MCVVHQTLQLLITVPFAAYPTEHGTRYLRSGTGTRSEDETTSLPQTHRHNVLKMYILLLHNAQCFPVPIIPHNPPNPVCVRLVPKPMTMVIGLGTRLPVRMRTRSENGVLRNGQQTQCYEQLFLTRVKLKL